MRVPLEVNGSRVEVEDGGASLLEVLREQLGLRSPKDGCSPQGQCGCCTVWVDGSPRVACVTPLRRVAGRTVTTLEGLDARTREAWSEAFCSTGASQCGFCTPGIIMRLAAGARNSPASSSATPRSAPGTVRADVPATERSLLAHLCRCTGWRTILEAAERVALGAPGGPEGASGRGRDLDAAAARATIEGGTPQQVGVRIVQGWGGFADDTAPAGALVAVPDGSGGWAVGENLLEARRLAGKVQGRRSSRGLSHPLELPPGDWDLTLRTTWVEPGYLETDASWCEPGSEPASPLANGGAFGGKAASSAPRAARELADRYGRPVRVLLSREDTVRLGPKRPPVAAGVRSDGSGVVRVARAPGVAENIRRAAPLLAVEELDVDGPAVSAALRAAGWAEAAVLEAAAEHLSKGGVAASGRRPTARVIAPSGAVAEASVGPERVEVTVSCGDPLDAVVLRSYCVGAAHMALGWVRSEGLAVDSDGVPADLTIRSFGILAARDTPEVAVEIRGSDGPPVNGSDAVFAAVAAAAWIADGLPPEWPTRRRAA
jgi:xanthine dehydrogenase small subunit